VDEIFPRLFGSQLTPINPLQQAADGIRQALGEEVVNCAEMAGYVDTLLASPGPFDERKLGGGPWQVVYSRGTLLWQGWSAPGKVAKFENPASQNFDPEHRSAVNKAEVFGRNVFVTASGTYSPAAKPPAEGETLLTPVKVAVTIDKGALHWFGKEISLPIKGKAAFYVMYLDDNVRVFQNGKKPGSSLVVQVRHDVLPRLRAGTFEF